MFDMRYKNEYGCITFGGSDADIRSLKVEGLGNPTADYKTIEFADGNGVVTVGRRDLPRPITLSADIRNDADGHVRRRMNRILHADGSLYCIFDTQRRRIECKVIQPPEFVKVGAGIYSFAIQWQADYPYFTDWYDTTVQLFSIKPLLTTKTVLPSAFSKRISRATIDVGGDLNIYPVLKIINTNTASDTTGTVTITNHSTGAFIKLNHVLADGEIVTTDIKHRRIESSVHGDITDKISDDTVLANFFLQVGLNDLEFINTSIGQELNATATYNNEYFSAEV